MSEVCDGMLSEFQPRSHDPVGCSIFVDRRHWMPGHRRSTVVRKVRLVGWHWQSEVSVDLVSRPHESVAGDSVVRNPEVSYIQGLWPWNEHAPEQEASGDSSTCYPVILQTITIVQMPSVRKRRFEVSGPTVWNSLLLTTRNPSTTVTQFCAFLKTVLICMAYETLPQHLRDSLGCKDCGTNTNVSSYLLTGAEGDSGKCTLQSLQWNLQWYNNNNNNVTYIAQIRQSRKCAATCQHQTGMFSVDFWMWPGISQQTELPLMNRPAAGALWSVSAQPLADAETNASMHTSLVPSPQLVSHRPVSSPAPPSSQQSHSFDVQSAEWPVSTIFGGWLPDYHKWVSRFLMAQQHNLGHLVPLKVKSEKRESNHQTMLQRLTDYHKN